MFWQDLLILIRLFGSVSLVITIHIDLKALGYCVSNQFFSRINDSANLQSATVVNTYPPRKSI